MRLPGHVIGFLLFFFITAMATRDTGNGMIKIKVFISVDLYFAALLRHVNLV